MTVNVNNRNSSNILNCSVVHVPHHVYEPPSLRVSHAAIRAFAHSVLGSHADGGGGCGRQPGAAAHGGSRLASQQGQANNHCCACRASARFGAHRLQAHSKRESTARQPTRGSCTSVRLHRLLAFDPCLPGKLCVHNPQHRNPTRVSRFLDLLRQASSLRGCARVGAVWCMLRIEIFDLRAR